MSDRQFKPFSMDEVQRITGCDSKFIDWLTRPTDPSCTSGVLEVQQGCGVYGLDWLQTFEVFVAWRYVQEGGGNERALWTLQTIAHLSTEGLEKAHEQGRTFIVPEGMGRYMLVTPPSGRLGKALCTRRMMREFQAKLDSLFPQKVQS